MDQSSSQGFKRTDDELQAAYEYYVIVRPTLYPDLIGDSYFIYYGEEYYLREIQDWCTRNSVKNDGVIDAPKPVKIPRF